MRKAELHMLRLWGREGEVSHGLVILLKVVEATRAAKAPHKIGNGSRDLTDFIV